MGEKEDMFKVISKEITENTSLNAQAYDFMGDVALLDCNVELAKFNYYQGTEVTTDDEVFKTRLQKKHEKLTALFGDVSSTFFDTSKVNKEFMEKVT